MLQFFTRILFRVSLSVFISVSLSTCDDTPNDGGIRADAGGGIIVSNGGSGGIQNDSGANSALDSSGARSADGSPLDAIATGSGGLSGEYVDSGDPLKLDVGVQEPMDASTSDSGQAGVDVDPGQLFPPNNGRDLCPDPQLHMRFLGTPRVGNSGKIQVFNASASGIPVAVVDLAVQTVNETIGGTAFNLPRPVLVNENEVIVRLPPDSLDYGQTYYVTVDPKAIQGPAGESVNEDWQFTTLPAPPSHPTDLRVAIDGTGHFCTVQGALDVLAAGNNQASTITIGRGTYFEIIHFTSKNRITLRGEDRKATIITGVNNNDLNPSTATRSLVGIDRSSDIIVENLTIYNQTPQDGSQAEALRMQNCDKCVVRHVDIKSLQDTLLWSGRIYANDCMIEGNVDFIWGTGVAFFDQCEIKTVGRRGCIVQARNPASSYGYVFVDSKLTADPGITGQILARIDATSYPGSHVAFVNCQMTGIAPEGWSVTGFFSGGSLRFWEYQSTDSSGAPIDVRNRIASSRQISADEAASMRDPSHVLGGWTPPK